MDPNWVTPQEQVDIINKLVHKNDTLIVLGDVGNVEWVKKIKAGYKVLLTGNHDAGAENYKRKVRVIGKHKETGEEVELENMDDYRFRATMESFWKHYDEEFSHYTGVRIVDNKLFDEIYTGPLMISDKIILSHEPIPNINWSLNIHGHDHSGTTSYDVRGGLGNKILLSKFELPKSKDIYHLNVCSNIINYTPINLKDIINSGALKNIDSLHRSTIDKATEKSKNKKKKHCPRTGQECYEFMCGGSQHGVCVYKSDEGEV